MCQQVMALRIRSALTPERLGRLIEKMVFKWLETESLKDVEILLSEKDAAALTEGSVGLLQEAMKKGVELKAVDFVRAGFRIGEKDGTMHYDFTEEGIAETLASFLNPRFRAFLLPKHNIDPKNEL